MNYRCQHLAFGKKHIVWNHIHGFATNFKACYSFYSKDMSYRFILLLSVLQLYNTNAWPFLMLTISAIYNSAITIYAIVHQRDYKATSCP